MQLGRDISRPFGSMWPMALLFMGMGFAVFAMIAATCTSPDGRTLNPNIVSNFFISITYVCGLLLLIWAIHAIWKFIIVSGSRHIYFSFMENLHNVHRERSRRDFIE